MGRLRSGALGTVVIGLLAACASPAQAPAGGGPSAPAVQTPPKRATGVVFSTPGTLNGPIAATAGSSRGLDAIVQLVSAGLTMIDNQGQTLPVLAEAVPTVDNGLWVLLPDGRMQVTWKIRPSARWHDGTPVTSADVLFADQLRRDRDLAAFGSSSYVSLESIEALDASTVRTTWLRPYIYADLAFGFNGQTSLLPQPRHILEKPYIEDKARFVELPYWTTEFVGNGPYKMREFALGSHLLLDANEAWVLGRPKIDQLEVKFIPDTNTAIANMLAGTIDVSFGGSFSLEGGTQIVQRLPGAKMDLASRGAVTAYPQFLNPNPPIMLNLQFRRALLHAADRQTMVDNLMFGQTAVAHSFVNPSEAVFRDIESSIVRYDFDPRRAAQMIEGLGYTRGADGLLRDAASQTISMRIDTQGGRGDPRESAALAVADNWRQIGVDAEVFIISSALADDAEFRANFPALDMARRGNYRFDLYRVLGSREAPLPENRYRGGNRGRYMNAELDAFIEGYDATIPLQPRNALLGQIVRHVTDQAVLIGLFYDLDATVYSERLQNVTGFFERSTQAWNVHEWDVK